MYKSGWVLFWVLCVACGGVQVEEDPVRPAVVSAPVDVDSDDPAIWIHPGDPAQSLVLGTDKGGTLFAFGLDGQVVARRDGFERLNNVDVAYGAVLNGQPVDIAVATDRGAGKVRVFRLPDLALLDGGDGIPVFEGEDDSRPMGVGLYRRPGDGAMFAILSRKDGPVEGYLWQYRLVDMGDRFGLEKVRDFGRWSGKGEIEAIAVDNDLGYVYYSDEWFGIRKYHADPDVPNAGRELAVFGLDGFAEDREGIAIFKHANGEGYILVSDQQADVFQVFRRTGDHAYMGTLRLSTKGSDGCEVTPVGLNARFPEGMFVAMSEDRTFQFYDWRVLAKRIESQKR